MAILFTQRFCQKSAERKSPKKYFLYFVLMSDLWLDSYFTSNKPIHYLLDYGDFFFMAYNIDIKLMHTYIIGHYNLSVRITV